MWEGKGLGLKDRGLMDDDGLGAGGQQYWMKGVKVTVGEIGLIKWFGVYNDLFAYVTLLTCLVVWASLPLTPIQCLRLFAP